MRKRGWRTVLPFLLIAAAGCGGGKPEPTAIILSMHQAYFELSSYQDSGVVENYIDSGTAQVLLTTHFSIRFQRPALFRVDWTDTADPLIQTRPHHSVFWSDGVETHTYLGRTREVASSPDLISGLFAATGISGGATHTIPSLLLPPELRLALPFANLSDLNLLPEEVFEGTTCYVISGQQRGLKTKLWIGREDYLLRKTEYELGSIKRISEEIECQPAAAPAEARAQLPDLGDVPDAAVVSRQIHRDIKINQPLPDSAFNFIPPEDALILE